MSRKSPTTSQLITAGLVGVGVGVLASFGYAALRGSPSNRNNLSVPQTSKSRDAISVKTPTRRKCEDSEYDSYEKIIVKQNISTTENGNKGSKCMICEMNITSEPSIFLDCSHLFHRKCLFSTYVVQTKMNNGSFQCPLVKCRAEIPRSILESLIAFH